MYFSQEKVKNSPMLEKREKYPAAWTQHSSPYIPVSGGYVLINVIQAAVFWLKKRRTSRLQNQKLPRGIYTAHNPTSQHSALSQLQANSYKDTKHFQEALFTLIPNWFAMELNRMSISWGTVNATQNIFIILSALSMREAGAMGAKGLIVKESG